MWSHISNKFIDLGDRNLLLATGPLIDLLVAGGFVRPATLAKGLNFARPEPRRWRQALLLSISGLLVEPLAWIQAALIRNRLKRLQLPDAPVIVIGHWRSGTTWMHQLLGCDPTLATARNAFTIAPQIALVTKPVLALWLKRSMTKTRPIDNVQWDFSDPQEDEVGLARLSFDTNMAGVAFPQDYLFHFKRCVLGETRSFRSDLLYFCKLTWLHDGDGKRQLLIKNSAHTARIRLLLKLFPKARFVVMKRAPMDSIRSLVRVKQTLAELVGLQAPPSEATQVMETTQAYDDLMRAYERDRELIPPGQLAEVDYDSFIHNPLHTVEGIYQQLNLDSWRDAAVPIRRRIEARSDYRAKPIKLEAEAEALLQELLAKAGLGRGQELAREGG